MESFEGKCPGSCAGFNCAPAKAFERVIFFVGPRQDCLGQLGDGSKISLFERISAGEGKLASQLGKLWPLKGDGANFPWGIGGGGRGHLEVNIEMVACRNQINTPGRHEWG